MKKISLVLLFMLIFTSCYGKPSIERTSVIAGIGHDIDKDKTLSSSFEFIVFKSQNVFDKSVVTTKGKSIFEMFNKRLLITKRRHLPGTVRTLLISEERGKFGISDIIDAFLRDQERNLNTTVAVSKQRTEEILKLNAKDSNTMAEEIEDLIKSSYEANFTQRDTNIKDFFNMYYQEGRHIMLPYIEKYKDTVKVSGIAVFKKDKLIFTITEEDTKYINLLRNEKAQGYLTFFDGNLKSLDLFCSSRRNVKVEINDNKIAYNIYLLIYSSVKEANIDDAQELTKDKLIELEEKYSDELTKQLQEIADKYQNKYGTDIFDVQKYAVAKLGRDKIDFIEENFINSNIKISAKIKILSSGRLIR
ncbi:Ger(x)C family spore germination protein [Caloramator sp. CAR-1]|uniref:Ger(x)C family spore germination protein n=2 Tax=unclassified Caloramator TaxID=2629145 RepID=UPI0026E31082|nr:Ger(x)C family spore germination protein [Caloramator sp. CAR-1]MDO6355683.1 Ger(x)C family spore germination protein [Caloramator sp. CAR-1]